METLSRRTLLGAAALPVLAAKLARAQDADTYPNKPVNFVVPFASAGGTDILARMLSEKLEQRLGKPFVIANRPGSGTVIATNFVAKSPPDGYTIMMSVSTLAIDATLYKKLPYDPAKDLVLVAIVATVPFVLVVNAALPVQSVADLIALAKQKPLSFGSGGIGTFHHLAAALFASMTGIKLTHVPYRGTAPALQGVAEGFTQFMFSNVGPALPLLSSGKVRALAVTSTKRVPALPNVPPLTDAGVPGYDAAAWQGVIAPAQTPASIVGRLNSEINTILALGEIRSRLRDLGMEALGRGSPEELNTFFQGEIVRWRKVVESAGIAGSE